jgi:hypothetical protein
MEIIGYICSILIGMSLGLIGSGGSILTVPVLVYLMQINPLVATTCSLFIVGVTSLVGGLRAYNKKAVDFEARDRIWYPIHFLDFYNTPLPASCTPPHFISRGDFARN